MADYSKGSGLHTYTVQEAVNAHRGKVIRVTPTLDIGSPTAFGTADVLLNNVKIPNAVAYNGGTSRLISISMTNKDAEAVEQDVLFHEVNTYDLGTVNSAVDISDANFSKMKLLGYKRLQAADFVSTGSTSDSAQMYFTYSETQPDPGGNGYMLLQAQSDTRDVFFSVILRDTPTFVTTTDLTYIFHIEY